MGNLSVNGSHTAVPVQSLHNQLKKAVAEGVWSMVQVDSNAPAGVITHQIQPKDIGWLGAYGLGKEGVTCTADLRRFDLNSLPVTAQTKLLAALNTVINKGSVRADKTIADSLRQSGGEEDELTRYLLENIESVASRETAKFAELILRGNA